MTARSGAAEVMVAARALTLAVLLGCWLGPPDLAAAPAESTVRWVPRSQKELPTTSARIFLHNLELEIEQLAAIVARSPGALAAAQQLAGLYHLRGGYRGDLDEIQRGIELLDRCVERLPRDPALRWLRARQQMSLHRFAQAADDLKVARETLGNKAQDWPSLVLAEVDLALNLGDYARAIPGIRDAAQRWPSTETRVRLAQLESALGNQEAASRLFAEAEGLIRDVDPLPVAWLNVQRGIHQLQLGAHAQAELFLQEARRRLPGYLLAEEHLAEVLHLQGRDGEAIALYEELLSWSQDPKIPAALAALYQKAGRTREADQLVAQAKERFLAWLARYPEAMAWHAAEFFLGAGQDPDRALDLLRRNFALRPNLDSLVALARAQFALGQVQAAHESLVRALELPVVSPELTALLRLPQFADLQEPSKSVASPGATPSQ